MGTTHLARADVPARGARDLRRDVARGNRRGLGRRLDLWQGWASAVGLVPETALVAVVAGATIGSLAESVLGATLEAPGILNNDMLNFLNTGIAAAAAIVVARVTA